MKSWLWFPTGTLHEALWKLVLHVLSANTDSKQARKEQGTASPVFSFSVQLPGPLIFAGAPGSEQGSPLSQASS